MSESNIESTCETEANSDISNDKPESSSECQGEEQNECLSEFSDDKIAENNSNDKTEQLLENNDNENEKKDTESEQIESLQDVPEIKCDNEGNFEEQNGKIDIRADNLQAQKEVCDEVENKGDIDERNSKEKGNYGEMKTDIAMADKGWDRISNETVTSLDDEGHHGIDGVYEKTNSDTGEKEYCIVESKYGSSQLGETNDGKQMSDNWIDKRLDDAVGKEKADEIREKQIEDPDSVKSKLSHIDKEGNVEFTELDDEGNKLKGN